MSDNIQPDGSWRDPTAQMAMDIGLGKVNPNSAGYATVEQAHQTYGSAHVNGLWGHHGNAPKPPSSGWHFDSPSSAGNRPFPSSSASAATTAPASAGGHHQPVIRSDRPQMSAAAVRELLGLAPLTAEEEAVLAERRRAAAEAAAQQTEPRAGDDWEFVQALCLLAAAALVVFLVA